MYGFRCKNCGRLVAAAHAGELAAPTKCPVCKAGVTHRPDGTTALRPENWEVLADATPERLAELGLTAEQVERHTPAPKGAQGPPRAVSALANDGAASSDRT